MRPPTTGLQKLLRSSTSRGSSTAAAIQGWRRRLASSAPSSPLSAPSSPSSSSSSSPAPARSPVAAEAGPSSSSLRAREAKLGWVAGEHRKDVAQCVELAERAAERWAVAASAFAPPPVQADAIEAIRQSCGDDVAALPWGGYPQAERCRVVVGPRDLLLPPQLAVTQEGEASAAEDAGGGGPSPDRAAPSLLFPPSTRAALDDAAVVAAAAIRGQFLFDPATHRDFLGAVLGTGISRDKVGDVVGISERGAIVLVDPLLLEHLERELTSVRSVPVTVSPLALSELRLPPPRAETLRSVEQSMRLDAVASAGFRTSRAKMADLIKSGDVKLQWRVTHKASAEVKQGDVVSVAGKGRLEVVSVTTTKNGRFAVEMVRRS